ncbi:MAG: hypothetical protein A2Z95_02480 [Gallionellales bacterium GWA2_60_18]|nr:MAG: hypothetical protein A2Z95_02480 [Gallionellales bacterium GWA2_60_18]
MSKTAVPVLALVMSLALPPAIAGESAVPAVQPPAFTLPGLDGRQHELGEWKDKVVLLNFWASWCSPCQTEIRDLVAYQAQYGPQGLQVVGIGMDVETKLRNVARTLEINYPVLFTGSPAHPLMSRYGNRSGVVPYSVLITREGEVVYTHTGLITQKIFDEEVMPRLK